MPEIVHNETDRWYFAYGSNLSVIQKESRTGKIREARKGCLEGYRITFNKRSKDGSGKANIIPDPSSVVWGVLYLCSPSALKAMDRHEGVKAGHYDQVSVRVQCESRELEAITYVAGDEFLDDAMVPSADYLNTILKGAQDHGLPDDYIREIQRASGRIDVLGSTDLGVLKRKEE